MKDRIEDTDIKDILTAWWQGEFMQDEAVCRIRQLFPQPLTVRYCHYTVSGCNYRVEHGGKQTCEAPYECFWHTSSQLLTDEALREKIACLHCGRRTRTNCGLVIKDLSSHWCKEAEGEDG